MKKFFSFFIGLLLFFPFFLQADETKPLNIYFFYGDGCPHCAAEELFLDELAEEYGADLRIQRYEVWHDQGNQDLLQRFADAHSIAINSVPATFIGQQAIIGFDNEAGRGAAIKNAIDYCLASGCTCPGDEIISGLKADTSEQCAKEDNNTSTVVKIPFIGPKDLKDYSLPVIAIIMGALDGFNPCAMWVLLFLITLLLGMKERWKMWLLGGAFIFASGTVYFLFMAAWLNFLMFLGYISWIRLIIGIFGIASGILFLREYQKNKAGVCKVVNTDSRKRVFERLKEIVKNPNLLLALGGIIILAFAVNLVELACSLGFPAVFTQILSLADLSGWQYYGYILLYLLFFMIDDILVFSIAMTTLKVTGFSNKYSRYSSLIGGILILLIGILLIIKPEWLMFS